MAKRQELREQMVDAALSHVPQTGWTDEALRMAALDLEVAESMSWRLFPEGVNQLIALWGELVTREMLKRLKEQTTTDMRIREKIALAVKVRLEILEPYKSAAKEALKYFAHPSHAPIGTKMLYNTVDEMWYYAGDKSTDYNFYTKRTLLAGVYSATYIYWLKDDSPGHEKTWVFLDHRIEDVLKIPAFPKKAMACVKDAQSRISEIFQALKP